LGQSMPKGIRVAFYGCSLAWRVFTRVRTFLGRLESIKLKLSVIRRAWCVCLQLESLILLS
jgi:hypothetical protein